MSSYPHFHCLSLSHISSFIFSSPILFPPRLFISHGFFPHTSSSPSPLHLPWVFPPCPFISLTSSSSISFSLISSSPQLIAPSIFYLNSLLPTTPTIGDALEFLFCPLYFCGGFCMKDAKFSPFVLWLDLWILWYVLLLDLYYLFIFYWICGFWTLGYSFVVVCIFFPISFLIGVVCSFVFFVMVKLDLFCFVVWVLIYIYIYCIV